MYIAAFFFFMTLSRFWEQSQHLKEPIRHLLGPGLYEAEFTLAEVDEQGGRSFESVSTGFELVWMESSSLPTSKSSWVTKTPDGEVKTDQAVSYGVRRLPFGLFLMTLQVDQRVKEPKKTSPSSTRSSWYRIAPVGQRISVAAGKNKGTGNRRVWDVSIKGVNP